MSKMNPKSKATQNKSASDVNTRKTNFEIAADGLIETMKKYDLGNTLCEFVSFFSSYHIPINGKKYTCTKINEMIVKSPCNVVHVELLFQKEKSKDPLRDSFIMSVDCHVKALHVDMMEYISFNHIAFRASTQEDLNRCIMVKIIENKFPGINNLLDITANVWDKNGKWFVPNVPFNDLNLK